MMVVRDVFVTKTIDGYLLSWNTLKSSGHLFKVVWQLGFPIFLVKVKLVQWRGDSTVSSHCSFRVSKRVPLVTLTSLARGSRDSIHSKTGCPDERVKKEWSKSNDSTNRTDSPNSLLPMSFLSYTWDDWGDVWGSPPVNYSTNPVGTDVFWGWPGTRWV